MDAFLKLPETLPLDQTAGALLQLLGEDDWALEQKLSEVPDIPRWTLYPPRMSEAQARRRGRLNRERGRLNRERSVAGIRSTVRGGA